VSNTIQGRICLSCNALLFVMMTQFAVANDSLSTTTDSGATYNAPTHSNHLDDLTDTALNALLSGDWSGAQAVAEELTFAFPDYALGHLILAEVFKVSGMAEPLLSSIPNYSKSLIDLLLEAQARAQHTDSSTSDKFGKASQLPSELIQVGQHIDHVVLVDLAESFLYLFDTTASQPRLIKKHYISSGMGGFGKLIEGDLKTPLGVYRIHGYRDDDSLPPLYGSGALMLNYPNALDRSLGRTGSGIWLHGNPRNNRSRSPRSSEGCVTMANDHLLDLYQQIDLARTSVVLTSAVQWHDQNTMAMQQDRFGELFEQYLKAWTNNNIADLTAIYTPDALPSVVRYAGEPATQKVAAVSALARHALTPPGVELQALAKVRTNEISILLNPDNEHNNSTRHMIMEFELNDAASTRITQYWEQNKAGFWQIKREKIDTGGV